MKEGRRGGNVLFNDAPNSFYLWLYGVNHMVKEHSDSERRNPLTPHGLLISIKFFYMHYPTERIVHTMAFATSVMEHWLEREIAEWVHHEWMLSHRYISCVCVCLPLENKY